MTLKQILNNLPILIIILGSFVIPLLQKVIKATREAASKREAMMRRERDELERLRTGRGGSTITQPNALETLTARAENTPPLTGAASIPTDTGRPASTRQIRLPGGVVIEVPVDDAPPVRPAPPRPRPSPARPTPRPNRRAQNKLQRQKPPPPVEQPRPAEPAASPPRSTSSPEAVAWAASDKRATAFPTKGRQWPALALLKQPLDQDSLRRALILNEVLGRPMSERPNP